MRTLARRLTERDRIIQPRGLRLVGVDAARCSGYVWRDNGQGLKWKQVCSHAECNHRDPYTRPRFG